MARLPEPGGDSGQWGTVLNDYLSVSHNNDGTLKNAVVSTPVLEDGAVSVAKIATSSAPTNGQALTYNGTGLAWASVSGSGTLPDASVSAKGIVQLGGDLGGTASAPTVPGLSGKEATITAGTTAQYFRGDKSWQTLDKTTVGLANVDNTSDADKPISTAAQTALSGKANSSHVHSGADITTGTVASARLAAATNAAVGAVQLAGDLGGTATSPTVPALSGKEATIAAGTTAQYFRGDKSWQTLDKTSVGLSNVDNTSDAAKPISTATQTALSGKASTTHAHSGSDITSGTIPAARLPLATESTVGGVQFASISEATTGTDTTKAVTAAGVKAAVTSVAHPIIFVDSLGNIPPGTPVDTLVIVRAA